MLSKDRIEFQILNYLIRQPAAKDTFQGIAEWWVLKQQIDIAVDLVSETLTKLVSKGFIIIKHHPDGTRFYKINEKKLVQIRECLRELSEEERLRSH
jgi:predicted transcriptional regulator